VTSRKREYWGSVVEEWAVKQRQLLWRRHSDAVNSDLLRRWLPSHCLARILKTDLFDEVVSSGLYPILAEHGDCLVGMDLSPGIVEAARQRYPGMELWVADVRKLPFDDACFDAIVSISTLDHFESQQEIQTALSELSRVLRPGGELLLTLDNLSHPAVWLRSILPQQLLLRLKLVPYRVGTTCGPRRLEAYCRRAGLDVRRGSAILHCPRVLAVGCASLIQRRASERTQRRFLGALRAFEYLERLPTRFLTGHFTAIHARKPENPAETAE
jgi:SAM-dependent methyltransferase